MKEGTVVKENVFAIVPSDYDKGDKKNGRYQTILWDPAGAVPGRACGGSSI
jgi:hypothetical protein